MFARILPTHPSNAYHGKAIAKWAFALMTVLTIARSLAHILLPDGGAQMIATIPLESYSPEASAVIIGMFAQWGLTQVMFGLIYLLVLWRYQALIPLMWLFILFEWIGRLLLAFAKPFETAGQAPGAIGNMVIPFLALIMMLLSVMDGEPLPE